MRLAKAVLEISALVLLCAVLAGIAFVSYRAYQVIPKLSASLDSIQAIETNTTRTKAELAGLLNETRHIAIDERKAQADQLKAVSGIAIRTNALLDAATTAVNRISDVSPHVEAAVDSIGLDVHETLLASQETLQAATSDLNAPELRDTMVKLDATVTAAQATSEKPRTYHG